MNFIELNGRQGLLTTVAIKGARAETTQEWDDPKAARRSAEAQQDWGGTRQSQPGEDASAEQGLRKRDLDQEVWWFDKAKWRCTWENLQQFLETQRGIKSSSQW